MTYYDIMFEAINEQYENGEITFEQAEELNHLAYEKYMDEASIENRSKGKYDLFDVKDYDPEKRRIEELEKKRKNYNPDALSGDDESSYLKKKIIKKNDNKKSFLKKLLSPAEKVDYKPSYY